MKSVSALVIAALLAVCLALTNTATASCTVDFSNPDNVLPGTNAGSSLSGYTLPVLPSVNRGRTITDDLWSARLDPGALIGGSLKKGGMFLGVALLTIGVSDGVLFWGTFFGNVTWTLTTLANGTHNYTLTGVVTGMMGGIGVNAVTVQLTANPDRGYSSGSTFTPGEKTSVSSVPEPSSLAMFLTGSVSVLGMVRRKLHVR
jgi:hypothetical protein